MLLLLPEFVAMLTGNAPFAYLRYTVTFAATSVPARWSFSTEIEVSVIPKNSQNNEIGEVDLIVRFKDSVIDHFIINQG